MAGWLRALVPPRGVARALSLLSGTYAVGTAVFLAGNAVFFTQVVELTPAQVGLGLSGAGVAAFAIAVPAGRFADHVGPRLAWSLASALEGIAYLAYPWVRGLGAFVALVVALGIFGSVGAAGRGAYTLAVIPRGDRVHTLALVRTALNIGFTAGALASGVALASGRRSVLEALPLVTGIALLAVAVGVRLMPQAPDQEVERRPSAADRAATVLRNRAFVALSLLDGQLGVNQVLLTVVLPLWLVERTDAPHAALGWLYGTNTVLAVLLQVRTARGTESVPGALHAARRAALAVLAACLLAMSTHWTSGVPTLVVLWAAYVAVTTAELFGSAASWGLVTELTDPARRAEYQGAWKLGTQFQAMVGPALCTWLAVAWSPFGFLVIAAIAIAAAAGMHPLAGAARRTTAAKPGRVANPPVDTIGTS